MKHTKFDDASVIWPQPLNKTHLPALGLTLADTDSATAVSGLLAPGRRRVFFMNAHCCNMMSRDAQYRAAVRSADELLPDGVGVAMAAKMTGQSLTANLNGTDLIPLLLKSAAKMGKSVYLLGGKPGTAERAADNLIFSIPGLKIAGTRDGYLGMQDETQVVEDINATGADIVLVALGVPLQETWIHRNSSALNANLTMGVGAALDFFAGNVERAPYWVRKARSEWVWRLAFEPRRLAKRYLAGNPEFLARAALTTLRQKSPTTLVHRALDIGISASALILMAPALLATAVAVKAESKGPALFKQTRIGLDGKPFTMLKFRSMVVDAEMQRGDLLSSSDREGVCFKSKTDPRITRVGRFIRRTSLDEFPQFLNVLRGEMAIVGPRPALPSEVAAYPIRAYGRLAVKPGITGVWQVSGRADISFEKMIDMDLAYAKSRTVLMDLALIAKTVRAVQSGRGAH